MCRLIYKKKQANLWKLTSLIKTCTTIMKLKILARGKVKTKSFYFNPQQSSKTLKPASLEYKPPVFLALILTLPVTNECNHHNPRSVRTNGKAASGPLRLGGDMLGVSSTNAYISCTITGSTSSNRIGTYHLVAHLSRGRHRGTASSSGTSYHDVASAEYSAAHKLT